MGGKDGGLDICRICGDEAHVQRQRRHRHRVQRPRKPHYAISLSTHNHLSASAQAVAVLDASQHTYATTHGASRRRYMQLLKTLGPA
jgi:hypothetical protein